MRRRHTLIGAMMIHMGEADGMLCGTFGTHALHLRYIDQVIGLRRGVTTYAAMNAVMLPNRTVFIADTYVNPDPDRRAARRDHAARRGGDPPLRHHAEGRAAVALELRHAASHPQAKKMRRALALINAMDPELEVEGEMHGDAALDEEVRNARVSQLAAEGRGEPADHADARRREHRVQPAQGRRRAAA